MSPKPRDAARRRKRASAERAARDATRLADAFERAARRVRHQRPDRTPGVQVTDPGAVHDLRVASRRLSSALWLWRPMLDPTRRRDAARALRPIRRVFGPVREIEVHIAGIEVLSAALPPGKSTTRSALAALERSLRRRYIGVRIAALATLKPRLARRMCRHIERACAGMYHRFASPRARVKVEARMRAARADAQAAIRAACQAGLKPQDDAFHRTRIAIKKWRYATERSARAAGRAPKSLRQLRELQDALGKAHDAVTLGAEIARFVARSRARKAALAPVSRALRTVALANVTRFRKRAGTLAGGSIRNGHVNGRSAAHRLARVVSSRTPSSPAVVSPRESSPGT